MAPQELCAGLVPARARDFAQVLAFRRVHLANVSRWDDEAYLAWRYRQHDAGPGFGDLLHLRRGGELIAILGLENLDCIVEGEAMSGVRGMDLLARGDLVDSGIGAWLNQWMIERYPFVLAMGANSNSMGIVRRVFLPLAPRRTFTHPLDARPFVARRWPRLRPAAPVLAPVVNAGLRLRSAWRLRGAGAGVRVAPRDRFTDQMVPAKVPNAEHSMNPRPGAPVHVCRSAAHLNRRLLDNPRRRCQVRQILRGAKSAGYVAWAMDADVQRNPELHIVDWQTELDSDFRPLLGAAVAEARSRGCTCVRVWLQDEAEQRAAAAAGFMPSAQDDGRVVGVQSRDAALAQRLARVRWALTDATDDADGF